VGRPASAKVGSPPRSATKPAATTARFLYQRVPKLFADLALARGDGRYARIQRALGGVQLLILDDWGLQPLDAAARHDLLEILEERYGRRSTNHQPNPRRQMAVRPEGANHQWRKNPPGELSIDPVADERLVRATARAGAS
jgi:IstB-like ATP binding protein